MSDRALSLQLALKSFLDLKEFFSNSTAVAPKPIPVVTEYLGDISAAIDEVTAKAGGLCVVIHMPFGEVKHGDVDGPVYDPAQISFSVFEEPSLNQYGNGIGVPGVYVADAILRLLHLQTMAGFEAPMIAMGRQVVKDEKFSRTDVHFKTLLPLDPAEPVRVVYLIDQFGSGLVDQNGIPLTG